mgnify:CR=1 FL=1|tara:strand:+ start:2241 stop:2609 length:369 start_codon:yes stop_codon:yes gene_type:complete
MIKFDTALDYNIPMEEYAKEDNKINGPQELTYNYITMAINGKYAQGLSGQKKRVWGRIQRKFDIMVDGNGKDTIVELEESEIDFIKSAFNDDSVKFPVSIAKYVMVAEDAIMELGKVVEDKK